MAASSPLLPPAPLAQDSAVDLLLSALKDDGEIAFANTHSNPLFTSASDHESDLSDSDHSDNDGGLAHLHSLLTDAAGCSLEVVVDHRLAIVPILQSDSKKRRHQKKRRDKRRLQRKSNKEAAKTKKSQMGDSDSKHDSAVITSDQNNNDANSLSSSDPLSDSDESDSAEFRLLDELAVHTLAATARARNYAIDSNMRASELHAAGLISYKKETEVVIVEERAAEFSKSIEMLDSVMADLEAVVAEFNDLESQLAETIAARRRTLQRMSAHGEDLLALLAPGEEAANFGAAAVEGDWDRLDGLLPQRSGSRTGSISPDNMNQLLQQQKRASVRRSFTDTDAAAIRNSSSRDSLRVDVLVGKNRFSQLLAPPTQQQQTAVDSISSTLPVTELMDSAMIGLIHDKEVRPRGSKDSLLRIDIAQKSLPVTPITPVAVAPPPPAPSARDDDDNDSIFEIMPRRKSVSGSGGLSKALRMMGMTAQEETNAIRRSVKPGSLTNATSPTSLLEDLDSAIEGPIKRTSTAKALKMMGVDEDSSVQQKRGSVLASPARGFSRRIPGASRPSSVLTPAKQPQPERITTVTSAQTTPRSSILPPPRQAQPQPAASIPMSPTAPSDSSRPSSRRPSAVAAVNDVDDDDDDFFTTSPAIKRKSTTSKAHKLMGITNDSDLTASPPQSHQQQTTDSPTTPVSTRPMSFRRKSLADTAAVPQPQRSTSMPGEAQAQTSSNLPTLSELARTQTYAGHLSHHTPTNPFRPWKRRYHVLSPPNLYIFKSTGANERPIGSIPINIRTDVASARAQPFRDRPVVALTGVEDGGVQRGWYLLADDEDKKREFMGAVVDVIMSARPTNLRRPSLPNGPAPASSVAEAAIAAASLPPTISTASTGAKAPVLGAILMSPILSMDYGVGKEVVKKESDGSLRRVLIESELWGSSSLSDNI